MNVLQKVFFLAIPAALCAVIPLSADTVILHDGSSYSGRFVSGPTDELAFKGDGGIQYTFPKKDVQSIVFAKSNDVVTLRTGRTYSGQYTGSKSIGFEDSEGVGYDFPVDLISSLVFSAAPAPATSTHPSEPQTPTKVIEAGADFSIRVDETIDSNNSQPRQVYAATVSEDVYDAAGAIAIPRNSPAKIVLRSVPNQSGDQEWALHLFSVTVNNTTYRVAASDIDKKRRSGFGANRRTAEFGGGGAGLGALLGAAFGGGRGAALGALSGGAGGLVTQLFTRGKVVKVPAETVLVFRLNRQLVLQSGASSDQHPHKQKQPS